MRKIALILLSMLLFMALHTHAQNKLKDIANKLEDFNKKLPIEKVHLHLDKPYYSVGDTIWVKAYVVDANNQFSAISNLLYVDLIDSKDAIKSSLTLPIIDGQGWTAIALSDTLFNTGNYFIRAYTTIMRNYGTDYFFNRSLSIINALPYKAGEKAAGADPIVKTDLTNNGPHQPGNNINLQFFPEGGNLVVGIASKVAFKAIGTDGLSRDVSGYVVDKDNNRLAEFKSGHAGMGIFKLFPTAGNSYSAVVNTNGVETKYPLPAVAKEGYGLAVTQTAENIQARIVAITPSGNSQTLNLVAQANNRVLYSGRAELKNSGFVATIPKKYFPEGIVQITLLTADMQPVAERLIFIKTNNYGLKIDLANDTYNNKKAGKSAFKIRVIDEDNDPAVGSFSMAVTKEDKVPYNEDDEVSIFSNLLLTADLKGYIEKPNYYFTDASATKETELDNLLLTQGWRRFVWDDLLQDKAVIAAYKPETGDVSGVVLNGDKKPVAGARVNLLFKTAGMIPLDTVTNAQGRFLFNGVWADKNDQYIVTATDKRQKERYSIELDKSQTLLPPIVKQPFIAATASQLAVYQKAAQKDFEELQSKGMLGNGVILKEVKVAEKKKKMPSLVDVALMGSANLGGKGSSNIVVTFKDLTRCGGTSDLGTCLLSIGKLINIEYRTDRQNPFTGAFYARGNGNAAGGKGQPMAIIQDGVPVDNFFGSINDIAGIEILKSGGYTAIYGARGSGGVIIITTKRGGIDYAAYENDYPNASGRSLPPLSNVSFAPRREFYVPPYNPEINNVRPQQATVYWAPNIITDGKGSAVVEFPAEQVPGKYKIVVEGIDENGSLGRKVYKYDIN
jgi:TonB-dependent SusC/RagA subfamily outer membrane receptor